MTGSAERRERAVVSIEPAQERDLAVILELIRSLAQYERLPNDVVATEERLRATLFGPRPDAEVVIARVGDAVAGFALYFFSYSTFLAQRGLYLEDLFVRPEWRGQGVGQQLLARLARLAVDQDCGRFEWSVLNWNESAIRLYESIGARAMREWTVYRMTGDELRALAASAVRER